MPIFSSVRETVNPGTVLPSSSRRSIRKSVIPPWPPSGFVFVTRTQKSARAPLVMKIFEPLMTYSSPSRIAVVRMPATSEPAPGSVIPRQPIRSPLIPGTRKRCFCSSVPSRWTGGRTMSVWTANPMPVPPEPAWLMHSARISE